MPNRMSDGPRRVVYFSTSYFYCSIKSLAIPTIKTKTLIKFELWKNDNSQLNQNNDIKCLTIFILSVKNHVKCANYLNYILI